jgi:hypothetical protein
MAMFLNQIMAQIASLFLKEFHSLNPRQLHIIKKESVNFHIL